MFIVLVLNNHKYMDTQQAIDIITSLQTTIQGQATGYQVQADAIAVVLTFLNDKLQKEEALNIQGTADTIV